MSELINTVIRVMPKLGISYAGMPVSKKRKPRRRHIVHAGRSGGFRRYFPERQKLTMLQRVAIARSCRMGTPRRQLAKKYGVSATRITQIHTEALRQRARKQVA